MKTILLAGLVLGVAIVTLKADVAEEAKLVGVIQSAASPDKKEDACRQLKQIGTAASVPALASLLADEHLYQAACDVLQTMPAPEANAALLAALKTTSGHSKLGVIHALGERGQRESVPALATLLKDPNPQIASSAARALGNIGGNESSQALQGAVMAAAGPVHAAIVDALLQRASQFAHAGENKSAGTIYEQFANGKEPEQVRVAAYEGLIRVDAKGALELVAKALRGSDSAQQAAALQLAATITDPAGTRAYADLLSTSPPATQMALLGVLQQRGDVVAAPAVMIQARSTNAAVRAAAIAALGMLGDATTIPLLANAATSPDETEQKAARQALVALRRGDVSGALVAQLKSAGPAVQLELIHALTARADLSAVPGLLQLAQSDSPQTRHAAFQALGKLADGRHFKPLAQLLITAPDSDTRAEIRDVFESIVDRKEGVAKLDVTPIATEFANTKGEARVALLQVSALFADAQLRDAFRESLKDSDARVRTGAARALCASCDPELMPELLELAGTSSESNLRALALEGYVRLASATDKKNSTPEKRTELLRKALPLAKRVEDKRVVLAGLAGLADPHALELTQQTETDQSVRAEAEVASLQIAKALLASDPGLATSTLQRLAASAGNGNTRTNAQQVLKQFDSGWRYAGPYRKSGLPARTLFDVSFAPEKTIPGKVPWRIARGTTNLARPGEVDLQDIVDGDNCVLYLKTRVFIPTAQPTMFEIGSDDGVKLWVNGELTHTNNAIRGLTPGEDRVSVKLHAGWNDLFVKLTQQNAGCGLLLHIAAADGSDITGLRFDPHGDTNAADANSFKTIKLSEKFFAEGANCADLNQDGKPDLIAGPFWFEGPDFTKQHTYRPVKEFDPHGYSDSFLTYTADFNGDGWPDIFCVPFPGEPGYWFENPAGKDTPWPQHLAYSMVGNESPGLVDLDGDGRLDLIFNNDGQLGYATYDSEKPDAPWSFHAVSPKDNRFQRFTHGIGAGDINGDGRLDLVEAAGWWEQPTNVTSSTIWNFHPFQFAEAASQMLVTDVDGDGLNDVICSWNCHRYGLNWYQQTRDTNGQTGWQRHEILSPAPDLRADELRFGQLHALTLADVNGDGLPDIVTGKRYWAHGPTGDVEPSAPAVLYWFELRRDKKLGPVFIPHLINDNSGVGTQVIATDVNGDQRPDIIVANKKGIFIHLNNMKP